MRLMPASAIHYCRRCGAPTARRLPDDGDTRQRDVCTACGLVHYQNPLLVVGTLPFAPDGRVLLCQRDIEPRKGLWTLPAGFMELGETLRGGALRETSEEAALEAGRHVRPGALFSVISVPRVGQVHVFYLAPLLEECLRQGLPGGFGHETRQTRLFAESQVPWPQLAFETVRLTLQHFFDDWRAGCLGVHEQELPS